MIKSKQRFLTCMFIFTMILAAQGTVLWADSWVELGNVPYGIAGAHFDMEVSQDGTVYSATNVPGNTASQKICKYDRASQEWISLYSCEGQISQDLFSMALNNEGTALFMAFSDMANSDKVSVIKGDLADGTWQFLGIRGFSAASITLDLDIEIAPDGTPYVCYLTEGKKLVVKKYVDNSWVDAGDLAGMAGNKAQPFAEIEINRFNVPYIVYSDNFYADFFKQKVSRVEIRKLENNKWVSLAEGLDKAIHPINYSIYTAVDSVTLSISTNDNLYVAYTEWLGYFLPYVKKFTGTSWESVGNIGNDLAADGLFSFSYKQLMPPGFKVTSQEQIYAVMVGQKKGSPVLLPTMFVMTYDTVNQSGWKQVGPVDNFDDKAPIAIPAIIELDMFGTPYIGYYDDSDPTMLRLNVKKLHKD